MKIENLGKPVIPTTEAKPRTPVAPKPGGSENVQFSTLSSALQKAESALAETPVVDRARIEEIKEAIRGGHFRVDANRIADGLIDSVRQLLAPRKDEG
ncbi:MAG: flagellar biosynthesis anti-sigma factor FlgM [Azoarcus sp.]|jgi:negative regulator of flagellin synthesis FlgM|nr:flagellar biosynthesis anti-sigma factor FlgM [Azoarcus sp.]